MKAYMSDRLSRYPTCVLLTWGEHWYGPSEEGLHGLAALREVRAILRETEPPNACWPHRARLDEGVYVPRMFPVGAYEALAESLAAFVALGVQ